MRTNTTLSTLLPILLAVLFSLPLAGAALAQQPMPVTEFVHQKFFEGVPYAEASRYDAATVPQLLEVLADPAQADAWTNTVAVLGIIGDERAVAPLIEFATDYDDDLPPEQRDAKLSVPLGLGYLINKSGNQQALQFLQDIVAPENLDRTEPLWAGASSENAAEFNQELSTMAILGLALSGREPAGETLRIFQRSLETATTPEARELGAAVSGVVEEALREHREISGKGLEAYYADQRPPR